MHRDITNILSDLAGLQGTALDVVASRMAESFAADPVVRSAQRYADRLRTQTRPARCAWARPASRTYTVRLVCRHGRRPRVTVIDPPLARHPGARALPHVYSGDELCLYHPGQWKHNMLLATTILPWTAEWLIHYELWLITGRWAGGGHTHTTNDAVTYLPPH